MELTTPTTSHQVLRTYVTLMPILSTFAASFILLAKRQKAVSDAIAPTTITPPLIIAYRLGYYAIWAHTSN